MGAKRFTYYITSLKAYTQAGAPRPGLPEESWLKKNSLRCVGFCLYVLHFVCEAE